MTPGLFMGDPCASLSHRKNAKWQALEAELAAAFLPFQWANVQLRK